MSVECKILHKSLLWFTDFHADLSWNKNGDTDTDLENKKMCRVGNSGNVGDGFEGLMDRGKTNLKLLMQVLFRSCTKQLFIALGIIACS